MVLIAIISRKTVTAAAPTITITAAPSEPPQEILQAMAAKAYNNPIASNTDKMSRVAFAPSDRLLSFSH